MTDLIIEIPVIPIGLNDTYKVTSRSGKARIYKDPAAVDWQAKAALFIGTEAARQDWEYKKGGYSIRIELFNVKHDSDAFQKLVIDTVAEKLDFNDREIIEQSSIKINDPDKSGIKITLKEWK